MKATIYPITIALPRRLAIVARPRGGDWLCDEVEALSAAGINVLVSMLTVRELEELGLETEATECENAQISFISIPICDRCVPDDKEDFLNRVDKVVEALRTGKSVGVHCRASIGRSSVLAVSALVRLGWTHEQAFKAVEEARGCSVPDTPQQRQWVIENIRCRDKRDQNADSSPTHVDS